jgi:hypothetical protein
MLCDSILGPPLAKRLASLVRGEGLEDDIRVMMCSHIGGHKVPMLPALQIDDMSAQRRTQGFDAACLATRHSRSP